MSQALFPLLQKALSYSFIHRALLAGSLIAISCSFLGIFLVLRQFSMIGHGLAHISFAAIAVGLLFSTSPIIVALPLTMLFSVLILKLTEKANIYGESSIGMVSSFALALGVMVASLAGGFNVDLFSYLFGSILAISRTEVILSVCLSLAVIFIVIIFYYDLFSMTYDEEFARVSGIKTKRINLILVLLTSITIVLGIRVVGTLLISSLIIFPSVTALQIARGFKTAILSAVILSVSSVILGVFLSFVFNFPTGATIAILNGGFFALAFLANKIFRIK